LTATTDRVCFDASAAIAFALENEARHENAVALVRVLAECGVTLCAPAMFSYECDSVLRLHEWKGDLSGAEADEARAVIAKLNVQIEYDPRDHRRAVEISRQYDQPRAYDAAYAAHAEARGIELVTIDEPFYEALNGAKKPKSAPALTWVRLLK